MVKITQNFVKELFEKDEATIIISKMSRQLLHF